jgi:phosphoribosylanthranilate isomerase
MIDKGIKIKVCGMRDSENIRELVTLKPDFVGFILFPGSIRYVGKNYELKTEIPESIIRVGVFVNELIEEVIQWVNRLELDYVQLHGEESVDYCRELFDMRVPVIKAFGINDEFDFDSLQAYSGYCDYFLFDSKSPIHGGSGIKFNWDFLSLYTLNTPVFLGGGIGIEDTADILSIKSKHPIYAVDVNSRFETSAGIKNIDLLRQFFYKIREE